MNISDGLYIQTLGGFCISANGKRVAADWPDEMLKAFFCSLLSPFDLSISWDRICRSLWNLPATKATRLRLEKTCIRPLTLFLFKELGFNPLIEGHEGIRIDFTRFNVDAHEFYRYAVEGLGLVSLGDCPEAYRQLRKAGERYSGSYLPGLPGKIIADTRKDLESLYRTAVGDALPRTRNSGCSAWQRRATAGMYRLAA